MSGATQDDRFKLLYGPYKLVEEVLARAVRQEAAAAAQHWWGVSRSTVLKWRKAMGADRNNNPGTRRLVRAAVEAAASAQRGVTPSPEQVEHRRQAYAARNARAKGPLYGGAVWTEEEVSLLGTAPDAEVGALLGRTVDGVACKRWKLRIAPFRGRGTAD
jgi:hypothetical protein